MWLYGYQPVSLPDAKKDGFRGFVQRGQIFEFPPLIPEYRRELGIGNWEKREEKSF